ncbi:MAG: class I SAM-dependent methyltransferase [Actinomycetota bacterium]|nr:class I SAM-dependent methyltransferase [Actinomycetota bacterium]
MYIERFLAEHAADVRGACLEVRDASYVRAFGGAAVEVAEVLDIDPGNPEAGVIADLGEPGSLPTRRYDCFIMTQTLHLIRRPEVALRNAWEALRPGGVLLLTVPALSRHHPQPGPSQDFWRYTPAGLAALLEGVLPEAGTVVIGYGNLLACVAFLEGLAAHELRPKELGIHDPHFPLIVGARVQRPVTA